MLLNTPEMTSLIDSSCRYITTKNENVYRPLTVWVLADFDTEGGRQLLHHAVKYVVSTFCLHL